MQDALYEALAFRTIRDLGQEVNKVVFRPYVSSYRFTHRDGFSHHVIADGVALFLKNRFRSLSVMNQRHVVTIDVRGPG